MSLEYVYVIILGCLVVLFVLSTILWIVLECRHIHDKIVRYKKKARRSNEES